MTTKTINPKIRLENLTPEQLVSLYSIVPALDDKISIRAMLYVCIGAEDADAMIDAEQGEAVQS
jgi:hypothetical protein